MKSTINTLAMQVMLLMGSVGVAHATGVDTATAKEKTATLSFAAPMVINNDLTAVDGLEAGDLSDGDPVATGSITAANAALFAIKWTATVVSVETGGLQAMAKGKSDPKHELELVLDTLNATGDSTHDSLGGGWYQVSGPASKQAAYAVKLMGDQTVEADDYTIGVTAAVYVP
ncbi:MULTISPECIES: hypothetical protein [unclassified Erwinia]|uniref:hypothetical protein n=1 Tax=unclassified Erwinia TaxID=2622719 RepID=UPI0011781CD1|nr:MULTISPECIES: hypothetical protein [unclassified Erwinia]